MEGAGKPDTAAASRFSRQSGKRPTSKTSAAAPLTPAMALEIFQQAVLEAHRAGVDVSWSPVEGDVVLFRLRGVRLCSSCRILRPAGEMSEAGVCRYCADISAHAEDSG
ncbi:hypothetical protein [Thermoflexus hugenholtzii]